MIDTIRFDSEVSGPTLVILGAVHGNEKCGPTAINAFIDTAREEGWKPKHGRVIFAPICNPRAYEQNVRFTERNLNRSLYRKDVKTAYEDTLDPFLCDIIDAADVLVDLHSYTTGDIPYTLIEGPDKKDVDFAIALGLNDIVYGFSEAYMASGHASDPKESQGTTEYARLHGALSVTVECGFHTDPNSVVVAAAVIQNALAFMDMIEAKPRRAQTPVVTKITKTFWKEKEGGFAKAWRNLDPIRKGEALVRYDDGTEITAPEDGVILLPKNWAKPGDEWFCVGVRQAA